MTKATYRKKALPFLLKEFEKRCAYCLDPGDFRHPSQTQVDHFDCKLKERLRHQYVNLMLACATCNLVKHDKPVVNPFAKEQRLLNCTKENEFLADIIETDRGQWEATTTAGHYHLESIGLREECHRKKRDGRKKVAVQILTLCQKALQYKAHNPRAVHEQLMNTVRLLLEQLDSYPPLVTEEGVITVRDWLRKAGVPVELFESGNNPVA